MKKILLAVLTALVMLNSCTKHFEFNSRSLLDQQSSKLITDWIGVHIRLIKNTTGVTHPAFSRHFSYTGVALYESLAGGDRNLRSLAPALNGTVQLPLAPASNHIFHPASANAAIAQMLRYFYAAKLVNTQLIDSLEAAYQHTYEAEVRENFNIEASVDYGKEIANAVIEWSKQDGASGASIPYTPLGEGYWEPTPPAFAGAAVPGWGNNRTILKGSIANTEPAAPLNFSSHPGSPFYEMVKEVHEVSLGLTNEQKSIAGFWDDAPNGKLVSAFGHWFNILRQILLKEGTPMMKAATAYLALGVTMNESTIACWKSKYQFHQVRPVTYIRKYMGDAAWSSYISTPPHPEYLAAHATISSSAAYALESVFGKNYAFADHTYESLGMGVRIYSSIGQAGTEAGLSRLYGGIHYRPSIEGGKIQGIKVGENVKKILEYSNSVVGKND
ncbi:MAG TPA: vanadium-dependent haloperoxidase [Chitinophagaceae bacterium]|nr:vanadium-dependent haloperoxidase [Chitinophagaceae bacterium]